MSQQRIPATFGAVVALSLLHLVLQVSGQQGNPNQPGFFPGSRPNQVCRRTLDLVFAIDSSNSLGEQNFNIMMSTINRAVDVLEFGPNTVRVGGSIYSTQTDVIELQTVREEFQRQISSLEFHDEGTNAHEGIRQATRILTASRRDDVPIAIMIITDGILSDREAAFQARDEAVRVGVDFWAVGVGRGVNFQELISLASSRQQAFFINTFDRVPDQLINLTRVLCDNAVVRPDLTRPPPVAPAIPSNPLEDLCRQSPVFEGVRYIPYPEDCTKVMQCYINDAGRMLVVTRTCPTGQFWNQDTFNCEPSWTVDCQHDRCKSCTHDPTSAHHPDIAITTNGTVTFPMYGGPCNGYWECRDGKSYPRCCPPLFAYAPGCGCKVTGSCWDSCNINASCADGIAPCYRYTDWREPTRYFRSQRIQGGVQGANTQEVVCPYGGQYDVTRCRCQDRVADILRRRENEGCRPVFSAPNPFQCNFGQPAITLRREEEVETLALRLVVQLTTPGFQAMLSTTGLDQLSLIVTADSDGIHGSLRTSNQRGLGGNATTLFLDATGVLEILLMYHEHMLTMSVTQDRLTHVALAEVQSAYICNDCQLFLTTRSSAGGGDTACSVQQMDVYTCDQPLHRMYS